MIKGLNVCFIDDGVPTTLDVDSLDEKPHERDKVSQIISQNQLNAYLEWNEKH